MNIHIDGLRIRVRTDSFTTADAEQLGERVRALLIERLTAVDSRRSQEIGAVRVKVQADHGATVDHMAARVVDAIMRQL